MNLKLQGRIIATLLVDETGFIIALEEGKVTSDDWIAVHITEDELLQMNTFIRKKWLKAKEDMDAHNNKYPKTTDDSF